MRKNQKGQKNCQDHSEIRISRENANTSNQSNKSGSSQHNSLSGSEDVETITSWENSKRKPLKIYTVEKFYENNETSEYFVTYKNYRLSEVMNTWEEAEEWIEENLISTALAIIMIENQNETISTEKFKETVENN